MYYLALYLIFLVYIFPNKKLNTRKQIKVAEIRVGLWRPETSLRTDLVFRETVTVYSVGLCSQYSVCTVAQLITPTVQLEKCWERDQEEIETFWPWNKPLCWGHSCYCQLLQTMKLGHNVNRRILFKRNHRHDVNEFSFVSFSQSLISVLMYEYSRNFVK